MIRTLTSREAHDLVMHAAAARGLKWGTRNRALLAAPQHYVHGCAAWKNWHTVHPLIRDQRAQAETPDAQQRKRQEINYSKGYDYTPTEGA